MVLESHLWVDDKENLNKFGDKVGICKIVSVAEHCLQPGDQGGGAGARHHLSHKLGNIGLAHNEPLTSY